MSKKILIAKVTAPHGIKGEVKIVAFCNDLTELETIPLYDKNGEERKLTVNNGSLAANKKTQNDDLIAIARIEGIDDRNKSEASRGMELFANREDFAKTQDDEFYITDLIGLDVVNNGKKIGKVLNIYDFGGGAMLEIEFLDGKAPKGYEKIENIAFKDEFFPKVDLDKRFIEMAEVEVVSE